MGEAIKGITVKNIIIGKLFPVATENHKRTWWPVNEEYMFVADKALSPHSRKKNLIIH